MERSFCFTSLGNPFECIDSIRRKIFLCALRTNLRWDICRCHRECCVEEATKVWLDHITETLRNGISGRILPQGDKSLIDDLYCLLSYREMVCLHHGLCQLHRFLVQMQDVLRPLLHRCLGLYSCQKLMQGSPRGGEPNGLLNLLVIGTIILDADSIADHHHFGQGEQQLRGGIGEREVVVLLVNAVPSEQVWPPDVSTCPPM